MSQHQLKMLAVKRDSELIFLNFTLLSSVNSAI
jgi:hypothetical protein